MADFRKHHQRFFTELARQLPELERRSRLLQETDAPAEQQQYLGFILHLLHNITGTAAMLQLAEIEEQTRGLLDHLRHLSTSGQRPAAETVRRIGATLTRLRALTDAALQSHDGV